MRVNVVVSGWDASNLAARPIWPAVESRLRKARVCMCLTSASTGAQR
jgi:hypothetical protein